MKIKFRTVPDPILRKKSKAVPSPDEPIGGDKKLSNFIKKLKKALIEAENPPGVGLSAVQIGKLWRIFLARKDSKSEPMVFINPTITWQSKKLTTGIPDRENKLEGCLSVPGYYGLVKRAKKIKLKYYIIHNSKFIIHHSIFSGFLATVIQHEMDHLNGILFIDRVLEQKNKLYKVEKEDEKEVLQPIL